MADNGAAREPRFGRVLTAMITPMDEAGGVDCGGAGRLARWLAAHGSDGLVVSGTTGESATLSHDEKLRLFRAVRAAAPPHVKVLAGTGSYDTAATVSLSCEAAETGADGLLVVTPYYNKPSQEGLYRHYRAVAEATPLPLVLYNVPARTGVNLEAATVARLAQAPNIVGVKEASGLLAQVGEIVAGTPDDFLVYGGADEINLPILALGGVGNISVIAHVVGPDLQAMHRAFFCGDLDTARRLHLRTLPMTKAMFSLPSPVPTKTALALLGVLPSPRVRLPLVEADEAQGAAIRASLADYGLLADARND
jgi:4-hydroxy-tetrahydrodipicolinate synthase